MLYYLTLILTSSIALIGILVKTKDDSKQSKFYKLTTGGWLLLTFVILLFFFNLFSQFQKDKIQKLENVNALQKKTSDSTLQAMQRQQLEILLQKQLQKAYTDSLYFLNQLSATDSLVYKQNISLTDQRATVTEQRANNSYLRAELAKQKDVNNSLTYPIDTLWLNAIIDIQLNDIVKSKLKERKSELSDPEKLLWGSMDLNFFFPAYKFDSVLFNFIKDLEVQVFAQRSAVYYKFSFEKYIDTLENQPLYEQPTSIDDRLPSFATLSYSYGTGVLELRLNKMKCSLIKNGFLTSLSDFCNNDTEFLLSFNGVSDVKELIKSANMRHSIIYENHLKYIDYLEYKNLDRAGKYLNNNTIILSSKGSCSFGN